MSMVFIVLPLALVVAAIAVGAYVWATRDGQFDDLVTPAARILHDDEAGTAAATDEPRDDDTTAD